jgi:hypothetical protein
MNHWPFIIAAYALTLVGGAAIAGWAYVAMRRAEQAADNLRKDR